MRLTFRANNTQQGGFTLVEILVIAPVVILVLAGMVGAIVLSTGSAMRSSARSQLQYEVLSALDRIEADVKISKAMSIGVDGRLDLATFATDRNSFDANRRLINKNTCLPADARVTMEEAATFWNSYWPRNSKLEHYTVYRYPHSLYNNMQHCKDNHSAIFQPPWLLEELVGSHGVTVNAQFRLIDGGVDVKLTATKKVAGEDVSFTGALFVKSLNTP